MFVVNVKWQKKKKNKINKEYEMRNEINFFCLIVNNVLFEKQ